ncbi:histidine phosphatase family protein [Candidatus Parcubacteria bacterium]|nr:histidine phosphatase family protein [Candidatus Parcubacteria bacterium]
MQNKYFILRHGQTIHQTRKKGLVYGWPDAKPPIELTKLGRKQVKKSVQELKNKNIDLIFCSDIFRTRQTSKIVMKELNMEAIKYDKRLRDINWGIFQEKSKFLAWNYYENPKMRFKKAPPKGESWNDCQNRMKDFFKEIDKKYKAKNILIISHGDPLWLLEGWVKKLNQEQLLKQKLGKKTIQTGELRKIN